MDATVSDPVVGRLLDGRYTVRERLAVGGMATVYVAHDNRLDRLVAVKVMHPGYTHDRDYLARFHREAKAAARLNSPHLVSVLDQGTDDGPGGRVVYLVMELIRGRTLRHLLAERGPLPIDLTVTIIEPVIAALAAAHHADIVHRDIKPENILLGDDGRVKVADFGLARPMATGSPSLTQGLLMGTVGYLAPEQVANGRADARSDVYAAGIVAFEMLTGQTPHDGATPIAVAYQHVHGDVPPPSSIRSDVGPALDAFVLAATARDPGRRPADGAAMLAELHRLRPQLAHDVPAATGRTALIGAPSPLLGPGDTALDGTGFADSSFGGAAHTGPISGTAEFDRTALDSYRRARYGAEEDAPPPPGAYHRGGGRRWLPVVFAAGLVILLIALVLALKGGGDNKVRVPSLDGMDKAAATRALEQSHLKAVFDPPVFDANVPAGQVSSERPAEGGTVKKNTVVHVALSRGAQPVTVPDVHGLSEDDAKAQLIAKRLRVAGIRGETSDAVDTGKAIRTEPQAGTAVKSGDGVTLIVSEGSTQVTIPDDLKGKTFEEAQQILSQLGLNVSRQDIASNDEDADHVVRTGPDGGQRVNRGETVRVYVSNGLPDVFGNNDQPQVTIPDDLVGQTAAAATEELHAQNLKVSIFGRKRGQVVGVNPGPGTDVPEGSTVYLTTF